MTRFMISLDEGISLVEKAFSAGLGGEIFVQKIPSMTIGDIADAIDPAGPRVEVGIRPGEKLHEQMISVEDSQNTWEFENHFRIVTSLSPEKEQSLANDGGVKVPAGFSYSSHTNSEWMSPADLTVWITANQSRMLSI